MLLASVERGARAARLAVQPIVRAGHIQRSGAVAQRPARERDTARTHGLRVAQAFSEALDLAARDLQLLAADAYAPPRALNAGTRVAARLPASRR